MTDDTGGPDNIIRIRMPGTISAAQQAAEEHGVWYAVLSGDPPNCTVHGKYRDRDAAEHELRRIATTQDRVRVEECTVQVMRPSGPSPTMPPGNIADLSVDPDAMWQPEGFSAGWNRRRGDLDAWWARHQAEEARRAEVNRRSVARHELRCRIAGVFVVSACSGLAYVVAGEPELWRWLIASALVALGFKVLDSSP